jgi:hypothetical protein
MNAHSIRIGVFVATIGLIGLSGGPIVFATNYENARKMGLAIGTSRYSEDVKQFLSDVDNAFDKHDYLAFGKLMRSPGDGPRVLASLDWAQGNMLMGSSVIVSIIYAESLWSIGSQAPVGHPYANFKETAAFVALYSLAVTATDGPKCADQSAPNGHFSKIVYHLGTVLQYFRQLPDEKKQQIIGFALTQEAKLARLRPNDNYLCRFGLEEIGAGLKATKPEDLPKRPPQGNEVGTQVAVPSPPGYEPKYVAEAEWQPKQTKMRGDLPALLANFAKPVPAPPQQQGSSGK